MNRHRRRRPTFTLAEISIGASLRGCTCRPNVERRHLEGIPRVNVYHADGCPAADTGPQLLLHRGRHQSVEDFARSVVEVLQAIQGKESA